MDIITVFPLSPNLEREVYNISSDLDFASIPKLFHGILMVQIAKDTFRTKHNLMHRAFFSFMERSEVR